MTVQLPARLLFVLLALAASRSTADTSTQLSAEQRLGRQLYRDRDLSAGRNQSCATCHALRRAPSSEGGHEVTAGFVDPRNVSRATPVSRGSVRGHFGTLNAPSVGYAAFSPVFHWDEEEGLYFGGQFWNGRAATLAEQAKGPFLNPDEMAMPDRWSVVSRLKEKPRYARRFQAVYGVDLTVIPAAPPADRTVPPAGVDEAYDRMADAIARFEESPRFRRFTSKYDFYLAGMVDLTADEAEGLAVFEDAERGNCAACHPSAPVEAPDGSIRPPLLTDFSYDNIGVPANRDIPGDPAPNRGLGAREDIAANDPEGLEIGKHKVMSLRNVGVTPPYGHNGVFGTLAEVVHFYNTRDVLGFVSDNHAAGFGVTGWPAPEVPENVNADELGNLGLDGTEEAALVAFLKTLTDGYPEWGGDAKVPPGTPSPFADVPIPSVP